MPYRDPAKAVEWRKNNKAKLRANQKRHYARHPEKAQYESKQRRVRKLRRLYGITQEDFYRMLSAQSRKCAICLSDSPGSKGWCIDHDHSTGKVRAVLCNNCNGGLGHFKDSVARLMAAAKYLCEHSDAHI